MVRPGLAGLLLLLPLLGCGLDSSSGCFFCSAEWPTVEPIQRHEVVGTYDAFQLELDGEDLLEGGVEITLILGEDGQTAGWLFVPAWAEDGTDLEADLVGRWTYDASEGVTLVHEADTFLRNVALHPFRYRAGIQLTAHLIREDDRFVHVQLRQR